MIESKKKKKKDDGQMGNIIKGKKKDERMERIMRKSDLMIEKGRIIN